MDPVKQSEGCSSLSLLIFGEGEKKKRCICNYFPSSLPHHYRRDLVSSWLSIKSSALIFMQQRYWDAKEIVAGSEVIFVFSSSVFFSPLATSFILRSSPHRLAWAWRRLRPASFFLIFYTHLALSLYLRCNTPGVRHYSLPSFCHFKAFQDTKTFCVLACIHHLSGAKIGHLALSMA